MSRSSDSLQLGLHLGLSYAAPSHPLIKSVDRKFHFLAVAVEARGKELEEAGEAEQWTPQGARGKADASRPLAVYSRPSDNAKDDFRVTEDRRSAAYAGGFADRRVGEIDAYSRANLVRNTVSSAPYQSTGTIRRL